MNVWVGTGIKFGGGRVIKDVGVVIGDALDVGDLVASASGKPIALGVGISRESVP